MIQKVTIAVVQPAQAGRAQTTGEAWERQNIIVKWDETGATGLPHTQYLLGALKGESLELFRHCGYKEGDEVEVDIEFTTGSYNERVSNKVFFKLYK